MQAFHRIGPVVWTLLLPNSHSDMTKLISRFLRSKILYDVYGPEAAEHLKFRC
jgi:hypothetical protein